MNDQSGTTVRRDAPNALLLAVVTGSGTLGMHIFVPALPAVASEFAASPAETQLTITVYLVGVALAQLVYGPISDRFGRRPTLLGGLAVYAVGSLLGAAATSLGSLVAARVLQAVGACGGLVLGRAMVRDVSADDRVAAKLALLNMAMMLAPASAPIIGGAVVALAGWRSIMLVLVLLSAGILVAVALFLPETLRAKSPTGRGVMAAGYARLLRHRMFLVYAFGGACSTTSIYAFLSASPFLFLTVLHRRPEELALYYVLLLVGYSAGNFVANRISGATGTSRALRIGCTAATVGAALLLLFDRTGHLSVASVVLPMMLYAFGTGIASPNAAAGAVSVDLRYIGAASGLYGFAQMSYGALCTFLVGLWRDESALPVATVLLASAILGQLALAAGTRAPPAQPVSGP